MTCIEYSASLYRQSSSNRLLRVGRVTAFGLALLLMPLVAGQDSQDQPPIEEWIRATERVIDSKLTWHDVTLKENRVEEEVDCGLTGSIRWQITDEVADQPVRFACIFYPQSDAEFAISAIATGNPRGVFLAPSGDSDDPGYRLGIVRCDDSGRPVELIREHRVPAVVRGDWRVDLHEGLIVITLPDESRLFGFRYSQPANLVKMQLSAANCRVAGAAFGSSDQPPLPSLLQRLPLAGAMAAEARYHKAAKEERWLDALDAAQAVAQPCRNVLGEHHQYTLNADSFVAEALYQTGHAADALVLDQSMSDRLLKNLGPIHPNYAASLENNAYRFRDLDDYAKAIDSGRRAYAVFRLTKGPTHTDTRHMLGAVAAATYDLGDFEEALKLRQQVVDLHRTADDETAFRKALIHLALAQFRLNQEEAARASLEEAYHECADEQLVSLLKLSGDYFKLLGRFSEAETSQSRAVELSRKLQSDTLQEDALQGLARLYDETYNLTSELKVWRELRTLQIRIHGSDSPQVADTTSEIAKALQEFDQLDEALREAARAAELVAQIQGTNSLAYAEVLGIQAMVYTDLGQFTKAEPRARQACEITRRAVGTNGARYARALLELSDVYSAMKDHTHAIDLRKEVIELYRKTKGADHVYTSTAMRSLAMTYRRIGRYSESQELMQDVLEIRRRSFGNDHRYVADALYTMAITAMRELKYDEASDFLTQAIEIRKSTFDQEDETFVEYQGTLGLLYHYQGRLEDARAIYLDNLERMDLTLGDVNGNYATTCENLGILSAAMSDSRAAMRWYGRALELRESVARGGIGAFGERLQIELLGGLRIPLDALLSAATDQDEDYSAVYEHVLFWKGAAAGVARRSSESDNPELSRARRELDRIRAQLSQTAFSADSSPDTSDQRRQLLRELVQKKEALETDIAQRWGSTSAVADDLSIRDIASALEQGEVFVDFFQYQHSQQTGRTREGYRTQDRLLAFVVHPDATLRCLQLGPVRPIREQVERFRVQLTRSAPEANAARIELGRLLLKPLNAELADTRRLFVSPDGPVAQIPLAILPTADSDYLLETTTVSCATSARQWLSLRRNDQPLADHSILAVGGITYANDVGQRLFSAESALDADQLFLVGSALELRQAGQLFSQSFPQGRFAILQGETATKTSLQDALKSPPRYLHLATHGIVRSRAVRTAAVASDRQARYFGLQPKSVPLSAEATATSAPETVPPAETVGDTLWVRLPRLRSALLLADERLFAGEGNATTEANDLLTAEEVMSLDLNGVELVVLSACDTGLGDLQNGQGVIGLQRSFGMAGARSSIGSLWAVDDAATSLLFERFYMALWQQQLSVAESLRQAQLYVLKNPAAVHQRTQQLEGTSAAPSRRQRPETQQSPVAWWGSFVTYGI